MPETVAKPELTPADDILDGVNAFATFTGFTRRRCFYLLARGLLPGGKIGQRWVGSKATVRAHLARVANGQAAGDEAA